MAGSLHKKIGIAAVIMISSVFLSNLIGLFREMVIAYIGGAGSEVDAYQISFLVPEILNHVVASGFLSITFIPIFSGYLVDNQQQRGWQVLSVIFSCFGAFLILLIVIAGIFTGPIVSLVAPGLQDPVLKASVIRMTRIIMPAQFFFFGSGLFMAVQFAKEKFAVPALSPLAYNLGIIAGGVVLGPRLGVEGFSWGVLIGAVANFVIQCRGALKQGMKLRIAFEFRHPDLRKYVLQTLPLMLGLSMTFSREFFFRFFGSFLAAGTVAGINYGLRIMLIPVALFGQAVGTASFPFMARLVAEKKITELNRLLNTTLRYISLVIPVSVLLIVLRHEVVRILFQRGKFDASATTLTAEVLVYLLIGAFALTAYTIVPRAYYAMKDTLFPAIYGTVTVILSVPLYYFGMQLLGARGVALALSLSGIMQVTVLYALWNRRSHNTGSWEVYKIYGKMMGFAVLMGIFLSWFKSAVLCSIDSATLVGSLTVCIIIGAVFVLILLAVGYGFKIREITDMTARLTAMLKS